MEFQTRNSFLTDSEASRCLLASNVGMYKSDATEFLKQTFLSYPWRFVGSSLRPHCSVTYCHNLGWVSIIHCRGRVVSPPLLQTDIPHL